MGEFNGFVIITAPHFIAGIEINYPDKNQVPPIVNYMRGWNYETILKYCDRKKWKCKILEVRE